jgi:hypothetical protein
MAAAQNDRVRGRVCAHDRVQMQGLKGREVAVAVRWSRGHAGAAIRHDLVGLFAQVPTQSGSHVTAQTVCAVGGRMSGFSTTASWSMLTLRDGLC